MSRFERYSITMMAIGLFLVGGYITYRVARGPSTDARIAELTRTISSLSEKVESMRDLRERFASMQKTERRVIENVNTLLGAVTSLRDAFEKSGLDVGTALLLKKIPVPTNQKEPEAKLEPHEI